MVVKFVVTQALKAVVKKGSRERAIKAAALREHKSSKSYKTYLKTKAKIPHDLTYMKGQLKD